MWRRVLRWAVPDFHEEVEALLDRCEAARIPPGTMGFAYDVVKLIEAEHPDWLSMNKKALAKEALGRFVQKHGGNPKDSIVNAILELAVSRWKAEPGHYTN